MAITGHDYKWDEVQSNESFTEGGGGAVFGLFVYSNDPANDTEAEVRNYLKATLPASYFNLQITDLSVDERIEDSPTRATWECSATYGNPQDNKQPKPDPGDEGESFTVYEIRAGGGETKQMTQSIQMLEEQFTDSSYQLINTDLEDVIGLTRSAGENASTYNLEGIPVPLGSVEVVAHAWFSNATITAGYLATVTDAAARNIVNLAAWKVFPAKTLRFRDFQATQQIGADAGWDFTYTFAYSPKVLKANINIKPLDPFTIDKEGHHYLDILYRPKRVKNTVISVPVRAAIHQIFPEENFAAVLKI